MAEWIDWEENRISKNWNYAEKRKSRKPHNYDTYFRYRENYLDSLL